MTCFLSSVDAKNKKKDAEEAQRYFLCVIFVLEIYPALAGILCSFPFYHEIILKSASSDSCKTRISIGICLISDFRCSHVFTLSQNTGTHPEGISLVRLGNAVQCSLPSPSCPEVPLWRGSQRASGCRGRETTTRWPSSRYHRQ